MAGYTRQSTFADGDTITAALFNNEYNQLFNAFSNTNGHKHDGTAAEGPVIGLIGDAGETSPNNKVLIDTTNNHIEFYVEVSSSSVQQLYIADGAIVPVTDSDIDIGTTSLRFKDAYIDTVTTTGNVAVGGNLTVTGTTTFNGGTITMGDAATDNVVFGADVDSHIIPDDDDTYDLGSSTQEWRNLYIDGTAHIDTLDVDANATVAGTLGVTGVLTGTSLDISGDIDVDGTTNLDVVDIDGAVDMATTLTVAGNVDFNGDLDVDGTTNLDVVDIDGAVDMATTLTVGGEITAASLDISGNVDIDGTLETDALSINGTTVTSTAAELNILDGVTSTAAELNILDGVTSTTAELNILDGVTATAAEINLLDGVTSTTAELNILDGVTATAAEINTLDGITSTVAELNILDGVTASATDINLIDGITNGTVAASKAIVTDANKDISGGRNITITGELDAATLDISGNADIDGTLEADAITIGGVTLAETISDTVGAMVSSNTETNITVTYDDTDNTLDFVIGTLNQDTTGNAATATALETARTIHGVSFDGTANIDLTEVVQDTVGAMFTSNTESGITVAYQDADGTVDFTVGTLNQDTTGNAATATALETARTIGGVSFDGTANINLPGVNTAGNQNTTGNASTATLASTVTVSDSTANTNFPVVFHNESNGLLDDTGALRYNPSTGELLVPKLTVSGTTTQVDTVTMNASNAIVFEGATADANETTLSIVDPTSDHTQYLINQGGYIPVLAAATTTQITSTPAELNILDGVTSTTAELNILDGVTSTASELNLLDGSSANTVVNSKAVIYGSSGQVAGTLSTAAQTNITSVGALNGGSITSGFGSIDVGSSAITTTGTVTGNTLAGTLSTAAQGNITSLGTLTTLTVDDITINGSTISDAADLTVDAGGVIILDADNAGVVQLKDGGTHYGSFFTSSDALNIQSNISDGDIIFKGNDGGSGITALSLDMSDAGTATFNHDIKLGDGGIVHFGAGSDLQIYHDGSNSIIADSGDGSLLLRGASQIRLQGINQSNMLIGNQSGSIHLYHNNQEKLVTTATGVTVTGAIGIGTTPSFGSGSGLEIERSGTCTIRLEDTSNKAAEIRMGDAFEIVSMNSGSDIVLDASGDIILDADGGDISFKDAGTEIGRFTNNSSNFQIYSAVQDVDIQFKGNDGGSTVTALTLDMSDAGSAFFNNDIYVPDQIIHTGDTDTYMQFHATNEWRVVAGGYERFAIGLNVVVNEDSHDQDFRVESNGNANMLFVDGGNNRVGIGAVPTARTFEVNSGTSNAAARFTSTDSRTSIEFVDSAGTASIGNLGNHVSFLPAGTERMVLDDEGGLVVTPTTGGHAVFNEGSVDADFRVESNTSTHALFVNGGNSRVGINDSAPDRELEVRGDDSSTSHTVGIKVKNTNVGTNSIAGIVFENYDNNAAYIRSIRSGSTAGILTFGINDGGATAESSISEKLRISGFLVAPESGVNIGTIRNNGVTVGTSATNILNLGSVNSSGDKGRGRYLVTVCAVSGTVGTAGSAIYGVSTSGAVYIYETVNSNSINFGSSGGNVTASVTSGSYSMHVNAIPLSVDN